MAYLLCKSDKNFDSVVLLARVMTDSQFENPVWLIYRIIEVDPRSLFSELQAKFPPDEFATAWERGKTLDLDTVVAELLASLPFSASG